MTESIVSPIISNGGKITRYEFSFSMGALISGVNYSFLLCVETNLSNGTRLYLQSYAVTHTIPLCTLDTGKRLLFVSADSKSALPQPQEGIQYMHVHAL